MPTIREGMPVLARHAGDWVGEYIYVDADGNIIDRHKSHLTSSFPTEGEYQYFQINRYTWPDGRTEEHQFPARYAMGEIYWDTPRIKGKAWETYGTVMLTWTYKEDPTSDYLFEMIQISECGNHRARTWHWFKDGQLFKRTLIKETRLQ
jgi:hypothetical protein